MELRHIRYFLAVAEELHFRRAAERLCISQPGLSRQIRQLEESLDIQLFERTQQQVRLTAAGVYLKGEFTHLIHALDAMTGHAKAIERGGSGTIRMGYVGSAMHSVLPQFMKTLQEKYPGIVLSLEEMDNATQLEHLQNHQIDLAFIRMNAVPSQVEILPVREETFSLVMSPAKANDFDPEAGLHQIRDWPFIFFDKSYSPTYYDRIMTIFEDAGFLPNVTHQSIHATTIFRLVEMDMGVSIVPTSLVAGYDLRIEAIELTSIPQRAVLYAAWLKDSLNPVIEALLPEISELPQLP